MPCLAAIPAVLNLWDCGGQDAFYESYFERDRETIFRSVELLIYVFDIESESPEKDFDHFCGVLEAIEENSPDARIFVLVHKMDLVAEEDRQAIFEDRKRLIAESCISCGVENFKCYPSSIWDESLYKAWSEIVTNLIPNIRLLETHLNNFCRMCDADEVVLFERATFLVISHAQYASSEGDNPEGAITNSPANNGNYNTAIPHSGSASSPPTDALDLQVSSMSSSPMTQDSRAGAVIAGDAPAPEAIVEIADSSTQAGDRPEETPRHVGRTPHFDSHRFEKVGLWIACVFIHSRASSSGCTSLTGLSFYLFLTIENCMFADLKHCETIQVVLWKSSVTVSGYGSSQLPVFCLY
jgi:Gtr1/RagA G protein conserved region